MITKRDKLTLLDQITVATATVNTTETRTGTTYYFNIGFQAALKHAARILGITDGEIMTAEDNAYWGAQK